MDNESSVLLKLFSLFNFFYEKFTSDKTNAQEEGNLDQEGIKLANDGIKIIIDFFQSENLKDFT